MSLSCRPLRPFAAAVLLLAACDGGAADEAPADADTARVLEGRSPAEIEAEAEALPPEVAESLGIVDTTIHLENLGPIDSLPVAPPEGPAPAPSDTAP